MARVNEDIQTINHLIDEIKETVNGLSEETIRWNPTVEEWSIMQILTHLEEALPYWCDEIEQLLEEPGKEWGRGLQHEGRLAAVAPDYVDSKLIEDVFNGLDKVKVRIETTLLKLNEETLAQEAPSRNPRFGTKPISFIVDHLLIEHTRKHLGQVNRNLSKVNESN
ncbi:DinB family protein [Alkalihalobacillus sp. 1P02AB]|uniref:DinB family protein n=1 Tax=Alkalihalobacillus sp. 1P02AB TaxID=3132260 RepID=UPI0039A435B0